MSITRRLRRAVALAVLAGGCLLASGGPGLGQEESPREAVERLLPALQSSEDKVRARAEEELFDLGTPARQELERLVRSTDPRLAATALRLLQSRRWGQAERREGAWRRDGDDPFGRDVSERMRKQFERLRELLRQRFEETSEESDLDELLQESGRGSTQSGRVHANGRVFSWKRQADGKVEVTVKEPGKEDATYAADSLETLEKEAPAVGRELRELLDRTRPFRIRIPKEWRNWHDSFELPQMPDSEDLDALRRRLRDWVDPDRRGPGAVDRPRLGISALPPSDVLREQLDLPEGGMVVTRVHPETLAGRLGLETHDVLVKLAGRTVSTPAEVSAALDTVKQGDPLTAVVIRKAKRLELATER